MSGLSGERDVTLAYMARFSCIGPLCEDHCCYGWRVDIKEAEYERLIDAASLTSAVERRRVQQAFDKLEVNGQLKRIMRLDAVTSHCTLLEPDGRCHVHARYGPGLLPDVCAIYPRTLYQIGDHLELTGTSSCPEVARLLLLASDAVDVVDLPKERLHRKVLQSGMDPRDLRPYWRRVMSLRDRFVEVLRDERLTVEQRLLVVTLYAKRVSTILAKETRRLSPAEEQALDQELQQLDDRALRLSVAQRFERIQAPAELVLLLARELLRPRIAVRDGFRRLVEAVFASYVSLPAALADDQRAHPEATGDDPLAEAEAGANPRPEGPSAEASDPLAEAPSVHVGALFADYRARREALRARLGARIDQYFRNYAIDYWMRHLPLGAPELLTQSLRYLGESVVQKFLLYSHPQVGLALAEGLSDEELRLRVDAVAVEVFYRVSRHVEHTPLLANMEKSLEARGLRSLAGATALVRF
jgi:lysine-N-methylase